MGDSHLETDEACQEMAMLLLRCLSLNWNPHCYGLWRKGKPNTGVLSESGFKSKGSGGTNWKWFPRHIYSLNSVTPLASKFFPLTAYILLLHFTYTMLLCSLMVHLG